MSTTQTEFERLEAELQAGGVDAVLARLIEQLREKKKYHELFEALKMRVRRQIGLPVMYSDVGDELDEQQRAQLEDGLLDACREVGHLLLGEGAIREGWMYLRPVGDRAAAARALADIEADEDNLDQLVEVTLHEEVDPPRGYALVLQHYGTCNAITTFEQAVTRLAMPHQQAAAGLLVAHVHQELLASVRSHIAQEEGADPPETTLARLVADRDWLFSEHSYHIDTTHLASTVRFARILEDADHLRLALDLTAYGRRLSAQFQYQGDEPFADIYPSNALFLGAALGEHVDEAVAFFRDKAEQLDVAEHGMAAIEAYIQLLERLGRYAEAVDALIQFTADDQGQAGQIVPLLLDLSEQAGDFEQVKAFCRRRDDLLGFASGLMRASNPEA